MRAALVCLGLILAPDGGISGTDAWTSASRWSAQTSPKLGPALVIGSPSSGCLQGAVALPPAGPGFELLHLGRRRYYGHPVLVDYVRRFARAVHQRHSRVLLVGDLSQARGGPTPTDHNSHQSGLDVDIAYTRPGHALSRPLDPLERESLQFPPIVDLETQTLTRDWDPRIADLLEAAASDPAVDRVFVNPVVKRELCESAKRDLAWIARIRPWWGHHDHFHVRLKCPKTSGHCQASEPLPSGDGCGRTLAWWFSDDARAAAERRRPAALAGQRRPVLPVMCREVLR